MEKVKPQTSGQGCERPPIQQCLRRGQEVIVQVTKEGIGTKGPTLTTYVSCPGRYLVMMPGMAQLGVSRKIEDLDQRRELKRTLQELNPPTNLGFIIRTAGTDVAKKELQGDLRRLVRMWNWSIANRIRNPQGTRSELYQESDLVIRTIRRDVFSDEIDRIIVDNEQVASRIRDFLSVVDPRAPASSSSTPAPCRSTWETPRRPTQKSRRSTPAASNSRTAARSSSTPPRPSSPSTLQLRPLPRTSATPSSPPSII